VSEIEGQVTQILRELRNGDKTAEARLIPVVYGELRRLAGYYLRSERPSHTLQPTALVHEAYIRLTGMQEVDWQGRAHFFAVAAQVMRHILVDHARAHAATKRGGDWEPVTLDEARAVSLSRPEEFVALDEALQRLSAMDARQGRIVELRFFGGLTEEETAEVLGVSARTIKRDWRLARAWLYDQISH
jgi:RNA polymerase sigma-70 factor, ECF subfamily